MISLHVYSVTFISIHPITSHIFVLIQYTSIVFNSSLLQIGTHGNVIPNSPTYLLRGGQVGNITVIVLSAITTLLDAYFAVKMSPITDARINVIKMKLQVMQKHFILLYQLKERSLGVSEPGLPQSRKLHAALCCIPTFLKNFGTLDKADTTSYESVHRSMTVDIWELTSKRYETMNNEMAKKSMLHNYTSTNQLISAVGEHNIANYKLKYGPKQYPNHVLYENVSNYPSYILKINSDGDMLCNVKDINIILAGSSISSVILKSLVYDSFGDNAWQDLIDPQRPTSLSIVQGISIEGMVIVNPFIFLHVTSF